MGCYSLISLADDYATRVEAITDTHDTPIRCAGDDRKGSMRGYPLGKLHFSFEVPRGSPTFEDSEAILDGIKFESAPWRL